MADPNDVKPMYDQEEVYFPKEVGNRYPDIQMMLCGIYLIIIVIGVCLIENAP